jgi:predicted nucleic acid-binding protein
MSNLVVDASVAVQWIIPEADSAAARALLDARYRLHAPTYLPLEVDSALIKCVRRRAMSLAEAMAARQASRAQPLELHDAASLFDPAWEIAGDEQVSIYDALYVALAERLNATLVTADARLVRSLASTPFARRIAHVADVSKRK